MRPAPFDYYRATTLDEAIQTLAAQPEAKALAGGHSLVPAMNLRLAQPEALVDIGRLPGMSGISVSDGHLVIGALTTHAEIAASAEVRMHCAALAAACGNVGDPQVRNRGTLGGNIAHADPASDPPTVLVACQARLRIQGPEGTRTVAADDFFIDLFTVDLNPGELITAIEIPSAQGWQTAYAKLAHPASRYAVVGVALALHLNGSICDAARVAIGGATAKPTRAPSAEKALIGSTLDATALENAASAVMNDVGDQPLSDIYADAAYRRAMVGVYLKRAVKMAQV